MIKAIAFDFDHTLYDRWITYENMVDDFCQFFADFLRPDINREEVRAAIKEADINSFRKKPDQPDKEAFRLPKQHWMGIFNATLDTGIFAKEPTYEVYYYGFIEKYFPKAIELFPDTVPVLNWLREQGYTTGILTNGPSYYQRAKLEETHMYELVDKVVLCGDLKWQKPHPITFESICAEMNSSPQETIYVGDNPRNDIEGARNAGMIPVWIKTVGVWPEELLPPRYSINTLEELPELLEIIQQDFVEC